MWLKHCNKCKKTYFSPQDFESHKCEPKLSLIESLPPLKSEINLSKMPAANNWIH